MKVITSTHYNRPDCTRQMIEHLLKCDGIEEYYVLFLVEPGFPEVLEEIKKYPFSRFIQINERLLGCWGNKKRAVFGGFVMGDYVIHIEDDVILSRDALKYFEWANENRGDRVSVTGFSLEKNFLDNPNFNRVGVSHLYSPIAWATWKDEYQKFNKHWNGSDACLQQFWKGKKHLTPEVSRAKHIGTGRGIGSSKELGKLLFELGHLESPDEAKNRNLLTNVLGEEWSKLDDNTVKSKCLTEYDQYILNFWSDDSHECTFDYYIDN